MSVIKELIDTLYCGQNPFSTAQIRYIDRNYPHTNIKAKLIDAVLEYFQPEFWLELGSFVGGSAISVCEALKKSHSNANLVCVDPFCGDVNMWAWEKTSSITGRNGAPYKFIGLEHGRPTIYDRFLSNVFFSGFADRTLPISCTSIIGVKLLERLYAEKRISVLPTVIYLDSAHEIDETYLELNLAWKLLPTDGILFGDDWSWSAVRNDVTRFSKEIRTNDEHSHKLREKLPSSAIADGILLYDGQWALTK